jgi:hypothetical protein
VGGVLPLLGTYFFTSALPSFKRPEHIGKDSRFHTQSLFKQTEENNSSLVIIKTKFIEVE